MSSYERKTFYKNLTDATNFFFDVGVEIGSKIPQYIIVTFEKNVNDQTNDSSLFNEMNVAECFCEICSGSYPHNRMTINSGANIYNVAYKMVVNFNRNYNGLLDNVKTYINHRKLKSSHRMYIFDTRCQKDHIRAHAIQLNLKFVRGVADIICQALVLNRRIISVNSDDSKMVAMVEEPSCRRQRGFAIVS